MPHPALSVTLPLLALALPAPAGADHAPARRVEVMQLSVHERIVIRVPRMPAVAAPAPQPVRWKEHKGPTCVAAASMAGALITAPDQVDLVLIGGRRLRAKLDGDCRPLDYYSGFYVRPAPDGMICARRDPIRVRSGASCGIDRFRLLQPAK